MSEVTADVFVVYIMFLFSYLALFLEHFSGLYMGLDQPMDYKHTCLFHSPFFSLSKARGLTSA